MAGIVIEFPGEDNLGQLAAKLDKNARMFDKAGGSLEKLSRGGISRNVQSLLNASGSGSALGILTTAGAGTALTSVLTSAISQARSDMIARYSVGASKQNYAYMSTLGGSVGGVEGMASMANNLSENLRRGGIGPAILRSKGIVDVGPYTRDKMDNLIKALDQLREIEDDSLRMFVTKNTIGPEAAPLVEMSKRDYELRKSLATTEYANEKFIRDKALNDTGNQLWDSIKGTGALILKGLPGIGNIMQGNEINARIDEAEKERKRKESEKGANNRGDLWNAIEELTQAVRDNTRQARNEAIHMGRRTMAAVPKAWTAQAAEMAMRDQARRLGGI